MTATAIGVSTLTNPNKAFDEAIESLTSKLSGQLPNLIFCFSRFTSQEAQIIATTLKDRSPQALLVGLYSHAFNSQRRFTLVLYGIASNNLMANTRVFPLNTAPAINNSPESTDTSTIIFASTVNQSLQPFLLTQAPASIAHPFIGAVNFGPDSWVIHNDTVFQDIALRSYISGIKLNFAPWHVSIPIGLPQPFTSSNNFCDTISNQPSLLYYQRYLPQDISKLTPKEINNYFRTYPLCFQQKQTYQFIAPIMVGEQNSLVLPIDPPPNSNMITLAMENTAFPDELIKQITQNLPTTTEQTPLLFTSAHKDFPTFINDKEQKLFTAENFPDPLRIASQGIIFNTPNQPPIYTSHGRLLANFS